MKSFATFAALSAWLAGCIGETERPPAASMDTEIPAETANSDAEAPATTSQSLATVCTPGTTQTCSVYYTTQVGNITVQNCTPGARTCRDDGKAWSACELAPALAP